MKIVGKQTLADQVLELYTFFKKGRDISAGFKRLAEDAQTVKDEYDATNTKWLEYHSENPGVFTKFERIALREARAGAKTLNPSEILSKTGQRKTNDFSPYYARLFRQLHPTKKGLFQVTMSRADVLFPLRNPRRD